MTSATFGHTGSRTRTADTYRFGTVAFRALAVVLALGTLAGCGSEVTAPDHRTPAPIASRFTTGTEGWTADGDYRDLRTDTVLNPWASPISGAFLRARDRAEGVTWYFRAPAAFRGDLSAYYGGRLRYWARAGMGVNALNGLRNGEYFNAADVIIEGAGLKLTCSLRPEDYPRANNWKLVSIDLDETDSWIIVGERIRRRATREQIEMVLADVTELRIRGEYFKGVDWGAIDDVLVTAN